ncbi:MAG: PhoX family phosphatase [Defluviicoccus sp.]
MSERTDPVAQVPADGAGEEISNPLTAATIGEVIGVRFNRREAMKGLTAVAALGALAPLAGLTGSHPVSAASPASSLTFKEIAHGTSENHVFAEGYEALTLMRWGDPLEAGAPAFDPSRQTAAAQAKQWGYNNDYVGYLPLAKGSSAPDHGLLCVNFEYTDAHLMFAGLKDGDIDAHSREQVEIEMAAHGMGIVEIRRDGASGAWSTVKDSPYNRRISMLLSECVIAGPAAGHARLKTASDPTGTKVIGTLNNCAGGKTPWGTILSAEENFNLYFSADAAESPESANYKRVGIKPKSRHAWSRFHDRFNVAKELNEPNRFGWIVEVDPYNPKAPPIKRTALGRFKHEGATCVVNKDGRLVVYTGDDEVFEYVYRFVSKGRFDAAAGAANSALLDEGTLSVARFETDGGLTWLPLVFGQGPLTAANGFASQADVLIECRRAADLLGATPMDRPEDVEPNPVSGIVYVALTNNNKRKADNVNVVNPRGPNQAGHILEMIPPGATGPERDHAADRFTWSIFLLAGDPANPESGARYHPDVSANGWLAAPDNIAFDPKGRIWIATDGAPQLGFADGVWAADTQGPGKALTRMFYRTPIGAEMCGPEFNTDGTAFFVAVQHPGDSKGSTFDQPSTRWPDFKDGMPPRPALQVIIRKGGGFVGV